MPWRWLVGVPLVIALAGVLTRGLWLPSIADSLVCAEGLTATDAIVVENFDPNYLLFERAASLQQRGLSARVLVPTATASRDSQEANLVSREIAELMARVARVRNVEIIPIHEIEPYSLNAAYQVRDLLVQEQVRSVLVLSPAFRSRRSSLVYQAVLEPTGIAVHCGAVFGHHTPENWTSTWHGIQTVTEQFIKLGFYRFYVVGRSVSERSPVVPAKGRRRGAAGRRGRP